MKLTTTPAPIDFSAYADLTYIHSANWQTIELATKKRAYARLYEQYLLLMEMEANGITVTMTMTSPAGTITVENFDQFEPMEYLNKISSRLLAMAAEILDLSQQLQQGLQDGITPTGESLARQALCAQAHTLCLPEGYTVSAPLAAPLTPATAQAA